MAALVGLLQVDILIAGSTSLKEKRMVLKSVKDRLRKKFNVSVAEVGFQDKWQRSSLAVAVVAESDKFVQEALNKIFSFLDNDPAFEITQYNFDYR